MCAHAEKAERATTTAMSSSSYVVETVVRGYHVYKDIWNASIGQILSCQRERGNVHDPYALDMVERGVTVGHVPRTISSVCSLFLREIDSLNKNAHARNRTTSPNFHGEHFRG